MFNFFKKSLPKRIPIMRMEDYHTHYLGKYENDNLFFGYETFVYNETEREISEEHQNEDRIDFAVLYLFNKKGVFQEAKYYVANTEIEKQKTNQKLQYLISSLGKIEFCDIKVNPFKTKIEGVKFGLIPDKDSETIDLQPSSTISFQEPWDGEYYT